MLSTRSTKGGIPLFTIGELARRSGLSRSALLYYDRIGLLKPAGHSPSGYRLYDETSVEKLRLICTYRKAGLSLDRIGELLRVSNSPGEEILLKHVFEIDRKISALKMQQRLLLGLLREDGQNAPAEMDGERWVEMFESAGMSRDDIGHWHEEFERNAPEAHQAFLMWLGLSEREAVEIRKQTRSIKENNDMMKYFNEVFHNIPRQGPGTDAITQEAFDKLRPFLPEKPEVLDVGCGSGASPLCLARYGVTSIRAVDNDPHFLELLDEKARKEGLSDRIRTVEASMMEMPFDPESFDLIWAEGSIFIIGLERGLREWKSLLKPGGCLAFSELAWFVPEPPQEIRDYFNRVYPDMDGDERNCRIASDLGYEVVDVIHLPHEAWIANYYDPIRGQVDTMEARHPGVPEAAEICRNLREEIDMYERFGDTYGYSFYLLRSKPD